MERENNVRVAHITDIHFMETPPLSSLCGKRFLGSANLFLAGRRKHFERRVQLAAVEKLVALRPDLVLITGDLTAQALNSEFDTAREALDPVLSAFPTLVIPGNHDVYTRGAAKTKRIRSCFGEWMHLDGPIGHLKGPGYTVIGLDPNRPTGIEASGRVPEDQLEALEGALNSTPDDQFLALALHYPILDRAGEVYNGWKHGLVNAADLIAVLERTNRRPDLIVHGHIHHGFHVVLPLEKGPVPIYNCGSSGYAWLPKQRRAAAMNLYTVSPTNSASERLEGVERFVFDGKEFHSEPGGAYATGR